MPSQLSIAQHAADLLGELTFSDIDATEEVPERMVAAWDDVRDAALRRNWWNFSIERTTLAADSATPSWGFDKQYSLAGDVVRVLQVDEYWNPAVLADYVNSDTSYFRVEGRKILTDLTAPLKVRWIVNSVDVGEWDPLFAKVMACDLADRLSIRFTASETAKARIKAERREALFEAVRTNAVEQPPVQLNDNSWIASRFQV